MFDRYVMNCVFSQAGEYEPFAVVYADRTRKIYGHGEPHFTITFRDANALDLYEGDIGTTFAEAYTKGQIDIDGDPADVVALAATAYHLKNSTESSKPNVLSALIRATRRSHKQQKEHVAHHYDLGNPFFRLWLDESMTYSCAYFRTPEDSLETAQRQKVDHVLRKLRLRRGDTLLDIGCGWGALVIRAVDEYDVRALGITLSEEQLGGACAIIEERGLVDKADVLLAHYEDVAKKGRTFDRIASVGMIEHVGQAHLLDFSRTVEKLLKPGGLALLHSITAPYGGPLNEWIDRYIFPGAYVPTIGELIDNYNRCDLRVLDVENLRPHYQMTLDHWSRRFEEHVDEITKMYDEEFVRMWRMYLRATSASFRVGTLAVHQVLVSKGVTDEIPLTREDLYR